MFKLKEKTDKMNSMTQAKERLSWEARALVKVLNRQKGVPMRVKDLAQLTDIPLKRTYHLLQKRREVLAETHRPAGAIRVGSRSSALLVWLSPYPYTTHYGEWCTYCHTPRTPNEPRLHECSVSSLKARIEKLEGEIW